MCGVAGARQRSSVFHTVVVSVWGGGEGGGGGVDLQASHFNVTLGLNEFTDRGTNDSLNSNTNSITNHKKPVISYENKKPNCCRGAAEGLHDTLSSEFL